MLWEGTRSSGTVALDTGKAPDDYDLMTVVVLDIFEVGRFMTPATISASAH